MEEILNIINESKKDLDECNTIQMRRMVIRTAKFLGRLNIWKDVFKDNAEMIDLLNEIESDCYTCYYFIDTGGELFGSNPFCLKKTGLMDRCMDGEVVCKDYLKWNDICTEERHCLIYKYCYPRCPNCSKELILRKD